MAGKKEPTVWEFASADEILAAFRGARIALSTQDPSFKYTSGVNVPFADETAGLSGLGDEDLYPAAGNDLRSLKERVFSSAKPESADVMLRRNGESGWYRIWAEPLQGSAEGKGIITAVVDIGGQKAAEENLRLALLELAHRSKNLLAVVLAIARQSEEESMTLSQFSLRFVGRIRSLALAHDVLTDESWRGATVFSLVRSQLSAFSENAATQSTVEGHNAYLKPNAVQYVGLALHELIAMSVLSGALSAPSGRLAVTSTLVPTESGEGSDLLLRWHEMHIPLEAPADKSRFGHALLEKIVPAALGGSALIEDSDRQDFSYALRIPKTQFF
jgi:two-component sensor histidine kinase